MKGSPLEFQSIIFVFLKVLEKLFLIGTRLTLIKTKNWKWICDMCFEESVAIDVICLMCFYLQLSSYDYLKGQSY